MKIIVIAHPNSKKPRVEKDILGNLHIFVNEPPLGGKANQAIKEILANYFKTKNNNVFLLSGDKTKRKIFEIVNR